MPTLGEWRLTPAGAAIHLSVGDLAAAGLLEGAHHLQHAIASAGAEIGGDQTRLTADGLQRG